VEYRFYFEELVNQHLLEISQKVSNDTAELYWLPVNGDTNADHYSVGDAEVSYSAGLLRATLPGLTAGEHEISVAYAADEVRLNTLVKVRVFEHPGVLQTAEDLERMKQGVLNKAEPWYADYQ